MRPGVPALEPMDQYETHRRESLRAIQRHKEGRRLALAHDVSLLFESRETVRHQIQEMARMEGDDAASLRSIYEEYDELWPSEDRLTATLFVEVQEHGEIKARLRRYALLERSITLVVGPHRVKGEVMGDHGTEEATTAVTYLAFPLPKGARALLDRAVVEVQHRHLRTRIPLPAAVRIDPN